METTPGTKVDILEGGRWVGPFTITDKSGRSSDHLVLSGSSGMFEHYADAPFNIRPSELEYLTR